MKVLMHKYEYDLNLYVYMCVCVFLVKTSHFIVITVPLTDETVDQFILVKPISQLIHLVWTNGQPIQLKI